MSASPLRPRRLAGRDAYQRRVKAWTDSLEAEALTHTVRLVDDDGAVEVEVLALPSPSYEIRRASCRVLAGDVAPDVVQGLASLAGVRMVAGFTRRVADATGGRAGAPLRYLPPPMATPSRKPIPASERLIVALEVLWVLFIVEAWLRFFFHRPHGNLGRRLVQAAVICVLPPWRLVARTPGPVGEYWFPRLGWRRPDRELRQTLERAFSIPMILIALLVLPVLILEFFWQQTVREHAWLALTLELANSVIWLAFTVEFLVLISVSFSLFGFILGIWADGWEKLQIVPALIITPLAFLGGSFYSISMLPPTWQTVTLFNPVVYLISGFRWSFYENADVSVALSLSMTCAFLLLCLAVVWWIFRTGYKLRG